jgi:two-component system response regulator AtoC
MIEPMISAGVIDALRGIGPGPVSLKDIARQAAHAAERQAILLVLERTAWNRVRAAKLLEISYRALLYKIKGLGLDSLRPPAARHDRFGALDS